MSPAASTMGQKVSLLTSVTCPVTASAPTEVDVSIPLDLTGARTPAPLVSEAVVVVVASSRLLFCWAPAAQLLLLPTAKKTAGRHVGAGEEASPWDEEMVGMRSAIIGLVRTRWWWWWTDRRAS